MPYFFLSNVFSQGKSLVLLFSISQALAQTLHMVDAQ